MLTRLIYFRPKKRYVETELRDKKITCFIRDELTFVEASISVPAYLSLFQHVQPKMNKTKEKLTSTSNQAGAVPGSGSQNEQHEKISFHLIGSSQTPPMGEYKDSVDRVEFHGQIGYEEPIFDIVRQLRGLRKVGFYLSPSMQGKFTQTSTNEDNKPENSMPSKYVNKSVTSLKIVLEQDQGNLDGKGEQNKSPPLPAELTETFSTIVIRILQRMSGMCPNLRRLTLKVPDWKGVRPAVEDFLRKMTYLKSTKISEEHGHIHVSKHTEGATSGSDSGQTTSVVTETGIKSFGELPAAGDTNTDKAMAETSASCQQLEEKPESAADEEDADTTPVAPDSAPCLVDMSKLLGSMLGIPTWPTSNASPLSSSPPLPLII